MRLNKKHTTRHLEDEHQIALIDWAKHQTLNDVPAAKIGSKISDYLFHIPNGGRRGKAEAARFKRMGVKAGVSDLMLALPHNGKAGLWIELKAPYTDSNDKNYPTSDQRNWLAQMDYAGYETAVCYGWLQARAAIKLYLWGNLQ